MLLFQNTFCRTESKIHCRSKNETEFFWTLLTMLNLVKCVETDWNGFESCESECVQVPQFFSPFFTFDHIQLFASLLFYNNILLSTEIWIETALAYSSTTHSLTISSFLCWVQQIFLLSSSSFTLWIGWVFNLSNSIYNVCLGGVMYVVVVVVVGGGVGKYGKKRKAFQLLLLGANIFSRVWLPLLRRMVWVNEWVCVCVCYVYTKLLYYCW